MKLTDIVLAGKGTAGKWSVTETRVLLRNSVTLKHLYHYGTLMLTWRADNPSDEEFLDYDTGWGSVSDQQGMNRVFTALGIPRYFSRKGGAEIVETDPENARLLRDSYLEMRERYAWVR